MGADVRRQGPFELPVKIGETGERSRLFAELQRVLATDSVNAYLFNPAQVAVAKKGFTGLWANLPILVNDLAARGWQ